MSGQYGVVYPLWDHVNDEGALLEQVAGEVGVDHITVPVVTGAHTEFRLSAAGETPHFHTEGGWHFRPRAKTYGSTALRPPKARWFSGGDLLAQVREQAAGLGVRLFVRLDLRSVRALVDQEPHLSQRNAWGQEVPFAGACALNPNLRELLRATLSDVLRYEPAGIELVDWAPDNATERGRTRPMEWHAEARRRLDVCFCASCRQVAERAGVDAEAAARAVRDFVQALGAGDAAAGDEASEAALEAYVKLRATDCAQWLQRTAEGDAERQRYLVRRFGAPPLGNCAPWVRLVRIRAGEYGDLDGETWTAQRALLKEMSALALPAWRPTFAQAADLVRLVDEAVGAGVRMIDFEGVNEAPREATTWLKQAVRKARRG